MKRLRIVMLIVLTCVVSAQWMEAGKKPKIISFDAPGAGTGQFQGTFAYSITPNGAIAGTYQDPSGVYHGYLRDAHGRIIESNQAACSVGAPGVAINPSETMTGFCADASNVYHGFFRTPNGTINWFDAPGAGTDSSQGTLTGYFSAINPAGTITGVYLDASSVYHGYFRTKHGKITTFDVPGAGTGYHQGTVGGIFDTGGSINPDGVIAGDYLDAGYAYHGFLLARHGSITTFDAPGAGTGAYQGTYGTGINPDGTITGTSVDANNVLHGYVRTNDGTITTFDVPSAGTGAWQGTYALSTNSAGTILGIYVDASNVYHGYVRAKHGTITTFDVPGAGTGTWQGTEAFAINEGGAVTGLYLDSNNVYHGFLRLP